MTLWRRTRNEVAGAWRSVRYDLDRHQTGHPSFGGPGMHRHVPARRPGRLAAFAAAGALAVGGATGGYLAVVNGAGPLGDDETAGEPYPLAAAAPGADRQDRSHEGFGRGAAILPNVVPVPVPAEAAQSTVQVVPTTAATTVPTAGAPAPAPTTVAPESPAAPTTTTAEPEPPCCAAPPVPTPTAIPSSSSESPSPEPAEPSADPEPTMPAPEPTPEGNPEGPAKYPWSH